jgi:NAD(P)-dependent dehydrogenase (short-subunit alcohol dehydrogenase family)
VTGAASGIGLATCERLCSEGAAVAMLDVDGDRAAAGARRLQAEGARAIGLAADVTDDGALSDTIRSAVAELGRLDAVFPCAGAVAAFDQGPFLDITKEQFLSQIELHLGGTFLTVKHTVAHLIAAGGGSIVTMGSRSALQGVGVPSYTAAKGGVVALTRYLAVELAPHHIRVNCICPGLVRTALTTGLEQTTEVPLGPTAAAEEIAAVVAFLLSDDASRMTGTTTVVDGGQTIAGGRPKATPEPSTPASQPST